MMMMVYSDIEMVLVEEVAKDVNVHCGACALGGISLLVGIKSVYVVTNPRYASVSSTMSLCDNMSSDEFQ